MAEKRFTFVSDRAVHEVRENRIPENTKKHTLWSANAYKAWAVARNEEFKDFLPENLEFKSVPNLEDLTVREINYWFSKFAVEVRKKDGKEYRHEVMYSLFCGLNRKIQQIHPGLNLFQSVEFQPVQQSLDGKLKEMQAS